MTKSTTQFGGAANSRRRRVVLCGSSVERWSRVPRATVMARVCPAGPAGRCYVRHLAME